ncbi:JAB domain-containing protein [Aliikangiella marina]|uniref:JAB domain-containing protein n=1 Tax=Aliikangiella marina TaxID=1712262 RepID=A0A545TBS7_9GAMM|nr:DNA repair protein RadC [Aliikangiella marina]TQV74646.1 JAB domain-containing protein [Aliikangiella marina]
MNTGTINHLPEQDRPREKLLLRGAKSLSDSELLAVILRSGIQGKNAIEMARDLLNEFGSLRKLFNADLNSFCRLKGIGEAKYLQVQACLELGQRYLHEQVTAGDVIDNPRQVKTYLQAKICGRVNEVFVALFLDNQHQVIHYDELFFGTVNASSVHPRVLVQQALTHNASAMIVAHNHPSGVAEPSVCDIEITQTIKQALKLIDVRLLDHLIVAGNRVISLAERGNL